MECKSQSSFIPLRDLLSKNHSDRVQDYLHQMEVTQRLQDHLSQIEGGDELLETVDKKATTVRSQGINQKQISDSMSPSKSRKKDISVDFGEKTSFTAKNSRTATGGQATLLPRINAKNISI